MIVILIFAASPATAEPIEIVIDNSLEMWSQLGAEGPKVVALRRAMAELLTSPSLQQRDLMIGLRTVGGSYEVIDDRSCTDTRLIAPITEVDPDQWREALQRLFPLGLRPLEGAIKAAIEDLLEHEEKGRLLIVTAGNDTCGGNIGSLIQGIVEEHDEIDIRVIGLGLDRETANAATLLVPTRNVNETALLAAALRWALLIDDSEVRKPRPVEFRADHGDRRLQTAEISFIQPLTDEATSVSTEDGTAEIRISPGVYNAVIALPDDASITVFGVPVTASGKSVELSLPSGPPVTLAVDPELPLASGEVYVQYWGAPDGNNAIVVADAGTDGSDWLTRTVTAGATGEVALRLPGRRGDLEARFLHDLDGQGYMILGRVPFVSRSPTASLTVQESVENRTPLALSWSGPNLPGDHITINSEDDVNRFETCIPATDSESATLMSPMDPGLYRCRYVTSMGRVLAQSDFDVFEILATLDFKPNTTPQQPFTIGWTGPGAEADFISLAEPESEAEEYVRWAPIEDGNPLDLRAPKVPGTYEVRYVRAGDGEVLARKPLTVAERELRIRAPSVIRTGTRFEVRWRGTVHDGDFVVIARPDAEVRDYLDWADTGAGSPVTLAAPFESGVYEIRYISSADLEITARLPVTAR